MTHWSETSMQMFSSWIRVDFKFSLNSQDMDLGDGLSFSRLSEPKLVFVEKEIAQVCECTGVFRAWYFWRISLLLILIACIVLVDYKMKYFIRGHDMIYLRLFFRLSECSQFGHMKSLAGLSYGVKLVILICSWYLCGMNVKDWRIRDIGLDAPPRQNQLRMVWFLRVREAGVVAR